MPYDDPGASSLTDARNAAAEAGLRYVSDDQPGISRRRRGNGFSYRLPKGGPVRDAAILRRVRALAVPPAWTEVWICPQADGHIQATGRDQKGRKQYRYHAGWRAMRDAAKYDHMLDFARRLPALRTRIAAELRRPGLPRDKVLATVVHLLDTTLIRVGNDDYARQNRSFGLTTLRNRHVTVDGAELRFSFRGKSGRTWQLGVRDRRVACVVRQCQELPGQELFQYRDASGVVRDVTSADVNAWLAEVTGAAITAKDFRTWAGTVLAAMALRACEAADSTTAARRNIRAAIERVAARLGNTPTICRSCYVHPAVLEGYLANGLTAAAEAEAAAAAQAGIAGLEPEEAMVLELLSRRLGG